MNNIEQVILHNLIKDENFARKVSPFLLKEYFHNFSERFIFETVRDYFLKYNGLPTKEALIIILDKEKNLTEVQVKDISDVVESITSDADKVDLDWLTKETEEFCRKKAIYNAIMNPSTSLMASLLEAMVRFLIFSARHLRYLLIPTSDTIILKTQTNDTTSTTRKRRRFRLIWSSSTPSPEMV